MHKADIVASLQKKGTGVCRVAVELDVNPATVSRVVSARDSSRRIAKHISVVLGIPVSQLWPGRYPSEEALEKSRRQAA